MLDHDNGRNDTYCNYDDEYVDNNVHDDNDHDNVTNE